MCLNCGVQPKLTINMTSVEIPLQGSDTEVIEISFDELPDEKVLRPRIAALEQTL